MWTAIFIIALWAICAGIATYVRKKAIDETTAKKITNPLTKLTVIVMIIGAVIINTVDFGKEKDNELNPLGKVYYVQVMRSLEDIEKKIGDADLKIDTIYAESDSIAYLQAYESFLISKKIYEDPTYQRAGLDVPFSFKLYNKDKSEISENVKILGIDSLKSEIEARVKGLSVSDYKSTKVSGVQVDSVAIKKYMPFFTVKKDEFSTEGLTWCQPKSRPAYTNRNGFYCYFQKTDSSVSNFRIRFQYVAEDWLFIEKIQFSIDGKAYEYIPQNMETDNGSGEIWEWFDESVSLLDKSLIEALANAKSAKMKLIGSQYYHLQQVTPNQLLNIKRSFELYKAMGGKF